MKQQDINVAASLFQRALELEGFSGYKMDVGGGEKIDFISSVAGEQGGLASLMMASDRLAVMQYGVRLWGCGYVHSSDSGDGMAAKALEDFASRDAAASYRAIESIDAKSELGLSLMIARDTVTQMCEKSENNIARLNPVPGFFFGYEMDEDSPEIPFESASDICAFGWRQMMVANRELVLSLGQDLGYEQKPAEPSSQPAQP